MGDPGVTWEASIDDIPVSGAAGAFALLSAPLVCLLPALLLVRFSGYDAVLGCTHACAQMCTSMYVSVSKHVYSM